MELKVYQIITIILAIFLETVIIRRFAMGKFKMLDMVISSITLLIVFIAAMFPDAFSNKLAHLLGIKSNINAILFGGILLSLWLNFRLWMILRSQDKKMARIVSLLGMNEYKNRTQDKTHEPKGSQQKN